MVTDPTYDPKASICNKLEMRLKNLLFYKVDLYCCKMVVGTFRPQNHLVLRLRKDHGFGSIKSSEV